MTPWSQQVDLPSAYSVECGRLTHFPDVAALADAGLTAHHVAAKAARVLRPGNFCICIGAGGLGHIGIQVMKAISPATLIVIDRNEDALKLAKQLGADHVIQSGDDDSFVKKVKDLTGGKGAEAIIDFVCEGEYLSLRKRSLIEFPILTSVTKVAP